MPAGPQKRKHTARLLGCRLSAICEYSRHPNHRRLRLHQSIRRAHRERSFPVPLEHIPAGLTWGVCLLKHTSRQANLSHLWVSVRHRAKNSNRRPRMNFDTLARRKYAANLSRWNHRRRANQHHLSSQTSFGFPRT